VNLWFIETRTGSGVSGRSACRFLEIRPYFRPAVCTASAVRASAGKNISIASSYSVTSTGVPNTVVVDRNDSTPREQRILSGTSTAFSRPCAPLFSAPAPG